MQAGWVDEDWPEDLDALVAAPLNHRLLFENEFARVLDTRVKAGETVPSHTHRWPSALYIMSWSDFVHRAGEGKVVADSRAGEKLPEGSAVVATADAAHASECGHERASRDQC